MAMKYRKLLTNIGSELAQKDLQGMRFLCKDIIPSALRENASAIQIFELLEKRDKLSEDNTTLLAYLLHHLHRNDLLKMLNPPNRWERERALSDYRVVLYTLASDLTEGNFEDLMFFFKMHLKSSTNICSFDLFTELEKRNIITPGNLLKLTEALESIGRNDLLGRIRIYTKTQEDNSQQREPMQLHNNQQVIEHHYQETLPSAICHGQESMTVQCSNVQEGSSQISGISKDAVCEEPQDSILCPIEMVKQTIQPYEANASSKGQLPSYRVQHNPRGICLIINNEEFLAETNLSKREGTHIDAAELEKVFEHLGFQIKKFDNQSADQIKGILYNYSEMNHENYDVFVCCILTHGKVNQIFGIDGEFLLIDQVTLYFTGSKCPTLLDKPKLFFIQACQGEEKQMECHVKTRAEIDADGPGNHIPCSIPDGADLLIGMATVSGYLSFRHRKEGSWYIQTLCNLLMERCDGNHDILTILTEVNRVVAEKTTLRQCSYTGMKRATKQMPQPIHTLRKQLFLKSPHSSHDSV